MLAEAVGYAGEIANPYRQLEVELAQIELTARRDPGAADARRARAREVAGRLGVPMI